MDFIYNLNGGTRPVTEDFLVDKAAKIRKGQTVKVVSGKITASTSGPFIGVAAENHSGEADTFNPRMNGDMLNVCISPGAVYSADAPTVSFQAGGTADTAVLSGHTTLDDIDFAGGFLVCASKAEGSANTDAPGDVRRIYSYVKATQKFTLSPGGSISAGDTYHALFPIGFTKLLTLSDCANVYITSAAGDYIVVGRDLENRKLMVILRSHPLK